MEKTSLISVIVPIYNVEQYLERCIESIINQTYKNIEIILVDDGSQDNSGKIADELAEKDERITVYHKENGGLSDARNVGIDNSNGEYLCFIDSDDFIHSEFLEVLYEACEEFDCEISVCNLLKTKQDVIEDVKEQRQIQLYDKLDFLKNYYIPELHEMSVVACNKLYKKTVIGDIRYPVGLLHEDEATTCKFIFSANKVAVCKAHLYYYFQRQDSIMRKEFSVKRLDALKAIRIRMDFYKDKKLEELFQKDCYFFLNQALIGYYKLYKQKNMDIKIKRYLIEEYRKIYKLSDKLCWSKKDKILLSISYLFPSFFGKLVSIRNDI